jgi:hypothetical protein
MKPIANLGSVPSPALLFDTDAIRRNLELMLRVVGEDASKLRPHIKTWFPASHKTCAMVVPHCPAPRTTTLLTSSWPS